MKRTVSTGKAAKPPGVNVTTLQHGERAGRLRSAFTTDNNGRLMVSGPPPVCDP
jgi:hypothetical protein